MRRESGSILVGVLALCLVMTIAAGSFILLATNAANTGLSSAADLQLFYAAESGMNMGLRWTKCYYAETIKVRTWSNGVVLTRGTTGNGFDIINGLRVKVTFYEGKPDEGLHYISSMAISASGLDSLELTQNINDFGPPSSPFLSIPSFDLWKQIYHPHKF